MPHMPAVAKIPAMQYSQARGNLLRHNSATVLPRRQQCECSRSSDAAAAAASLRQQQHQLTLQLAAVLQPSQTQHPDTLVCAVRLVHQGVAALLASPDWLQLQQAFQLAARQRNAAAAAAASRAFDAASASISGTTTSDGRSSISSSSGSSSSSSSSSS
ncbi:hypothetical protein COO60DRAFT_123867 [Scenedesmus sp. NREL 46B-D3]|nr:hypothetical protein COO60DRAFT_123867 [Scenedesmus sp. NREL 46B-D3]